MKQTAKLFMNGRSQAVRLPLHCRFEGDEVYIRRDLSSGDVILSSKPHAWDKFFTLLDQSDVPQDFMEQRDNDDEPERDLF